MITLTEKSKKKAKTPHLALTSMEAQGGAANGRNISLLMKSKEGLSDEVVKALTALGYDITKMFMSEKQSLLQQAIKDKFSEDEDDYVWIEDFDETKVIFCMCDGLYSIAYTIEDDEVELPDSATPVNRGVYYNPAKDRAELTPEAEDEMEEDIYNMVAKALSKSDSRISEVLKETKKEGDETLGASAYAYVPDETKPSTWKLRIDDSTHTRAAVAALGAGFRGNKVEIPSEDLPAVKRKVKAAYKKFFPDQKELPEVLKSNQKEITLNEEDIQKAVAAVEDLFKAQLKEKDEALEKAQARILELEKGAVVKAREEALVFVEDVEKRKELAKSLESLSDEAFAIVVKTMEAQAKVAEDSDLMKQMSTKMTKEVELHKDDSFDEFMKSKYAQKQ